MLKSVTNAARFRMQRAALPLVCASAFSVAALLSASAIAADVNIAGGNAIVAQAAPATPGGGAPQPAQPSTGPSSGQGESRGDDYRGPGCPYRKDQDLKLLV